MRCLTSVKISYHIKIQPGAVTHENFRNAVALSSSPTLFKSNAVFFFSSNGDRGSPPTVMPDSCTNEAFLNNGAA